MATIRISTDHPDLAPVLGTLDEDRLARIAELLEAADSRLSAVHQALSEQTGSTWKTDGVVLETSISGQASIDVIVEEPAGKVTFSAQLRPRNFFPTEDTMWQPGRPPLVMATDAWDVEGGVDVRFRTRVAGRPYTIQERIVDREEQRYDDPVSAVEAFAALADELAELALSREPTVEAWRPEEPAESTPGA
jgi:hypothetical protein